MNGPAGGHGGHVASLDPVPALVVRHIAAASTPAACEVARIPVAVSEAESSSGWATAARSTADDLPALVTMISSDGQVLYQVRLPAWMDFNH